MAETGPIGYGKAGSFEGFVSGGGIAQLARQRVAEIYRQGGHVSWCPSGEVDSLTTRQVAEAATQGDEEALAIIRLSARYLGIGLSILIDILNPEVIVIGSIFARNEALFRPVMQSVIDSEALEGARRVCRILPAALGESIGDYAALSIAASL
jgi:glucokinase